MRTEAAARAADLQEELRALAGQIPGRVAWSLVHPASGARVEHNAAEPFVAASIIKTPILMEAFRQAEYEGLDWNEEILLRDADKVGGSGVLHVLRDGLPLSLRDLAVLMTVVSDNTATNILLGRLGVDRVNAFLKGRGCVITSCRRKLYDREAMERGIHNRIAAGEISGLLADAARGALVSPAADADLLGIMRKQQYRDKIPWLMPDGVITATKSGSLDEVSHDCGVVTLPTGDWFALSIFTGDLTGSEEGPARAAVDATIARMAFACHQFAASFA